MLMYPVKLHGARDLNFRLCFYPQPCFMSECTEGSGESEHMRRFARSFAIRGCNKYQHEFVH